MHNPNAPLILLAMKSDLVNDASVLSRLSERGYTPIQKKAGINLAKEIGASFGQVDINTNANNFSVILDKFSKKQKKKSKKNGCTVV